MLKNERVHRIPLRYFTDIGKISLIDYRVKLHLEKDMKKLFESRKALAAGANIPSPEAKLYLPKPLSFNTSRFYWTNTLDSTCNDNGFQKNTKNGNTRNTTAKNIRNKRRARFFGH